MSVEARRTRSGGQLVDGDADSDVECQVGLSNRATAAVRVGYAIAG